MTHEEGIVKPDRIGSMDPAVTKWTAPSPETKRTGMRVKQLRDWIESRDKFTHEEEVIAYAMQHWDVKIDTARVYLGKVVEDFRNKGVPVLEGKEWVTKPQFAAYVKIAAEARVQQNSEKWKR